jgi:ribosomal protein L11 methyltransferase
VAVEVAAANLAVNGLEGRVDCVVAPGFDHTALAGPFDLILANILMGPLIDLAPGLAAHLAPGGRAVLSGLLTEQADKVTAAYVAAGLVPAAREDLGEWSTLVLRRPA